MPLTIATDPLPLGVLMGRLARLDGDLAVVCRNAVSRASEVLGDLMDDGLPGPCSILPGPAPGQGAYQGRELLAVWSGPRRSLTVRFPLRHDQPLQCARVKFDSHPSVDELRYEPCGSADLPDLIRQVFRVNVPPPRIDILEETQPRGAADFIDPATIRTNSIDAQSCPRGPFPIAESYSAWRAGPTRPLEVSSAQAALYLKAMSDPEADAGAGFPSGTETRELAEPPRTALARAIDNARHGREPTPGEAKANAGLAVLIRDVDRLKVAEGAWDAAVGLVGSALGSPAAEGVRPPDRACAGDPPGRLTRGAVGPRGISLVWDRDNLPALCVSFYEDGKTYSSAQGWGVNTEVLLDGLRQNLAPPTRKPAVNAGPEPPMSFLAARKIVAFGTAPIPAVKDALEFLRLAAAVPGAVGPSRVGTYPDGVRLEWDYEDHSRIFAFGSTGRVTVHSPDGVIYSATIQGALATLPTVAGPDAEPDQPDAEPDLVPPVAPGLHKKPPLPLAQLKSMLGSDASEPTDMGRAANRSACVFLDALACSDKPMPQGLIRRPEDGSVWLAWAAPDRSLVLCLTGLWALDIRLGLHVGASMHRNPRLPIDEALRLVAVTVAPDPDTEAPA